MRKEYDFSRGRRGPVVKTSTGKTRITIRLDDDVLAWFKSQVHKAGGGNYQTLINRALRAHMSSEDNPLEDTLRRGVCAGMASHPAKGGGGCIIDRAAPTPT